MVRADVDISNIQPNITITGDNRFKYGEPNPDGLDKDALVEIWNTSTYGTYAYEVINLIYITPPPS